MSPLHLHLRADLLEDALASTLDSFGVVVGDQHLFLDELVDGAWARDPARRRQGRLGALGELLLCDAVAAEAQGPLGGMAGTPGLRRGLSRVFHEAGLAGLSAAQMERMARRLAGTQEGDLQPDRVLEVARLYGRYRSALPARLVDEAGAFRRGAAALGKVPPPSLLQAEGLWVHGLLLAPEGPGLPTLHGRLLSLAALSTGQPEPWARWNEATKSSQTPAPAARQPLPVRLVLPATEGRPLLEAAITPLLESLYRYHDLDLEEKRVPLGPALVGLEPGVGSPWGRFLGGLFLSGQAPPLLAKGELLASQLSLAALPSSGAEAREVARAVRDLLDFGVSPAAINVVAQDPARRARIAGMLQRYGVPVHLPAPLSQPYQDRHHVAGLAPPLQALLGLYDLLLDGVPREGLIQHLSTRYLRFWRGPARPWAVARALREAGVRELDLHRGTGSEEPEYRRRLLEWLRQQGEAAGAGRERSLLGMIDSALGLLGSLPQRATLAGHVTALQRACEQLQLVELSRGLLDPPAERAYDLPLSIDDSAALSRDQEAVEVLLDVLHELPRLAQRLPGLHLAREPLPRERFARLLSDVLMHTMLRPRGARGAAVVVGDLLTLAGRRCQHLFLTGLIEGEMPGYASDDPVLSDDERHGLNRLLGRDVFPLSGQADLRAPLWFAQALAHAQAAHLSWPLSDDEGRPVLRSSFVDEVLRASARPEPRRGEHAVVPFKEQARSTSELWTRAVLDCYGRNGDSRVQEGQALLTALSRQEPSRAARLSAMIEMERCRQRWFAARLREDAAPAQDESAPAQFGPFVGRLIDAELRRTLSLRLPGGPEHPLSASALEDYAKCPFRFFLRRVLKEVPVQEGGDDLDPLAGGRLHHAVLERFFKERHEAGRLPLRGDREERDALDRAIEQVLTAWPETERTGHRDLFAVRVRRLREDLSRLIEREAREPLREGAVPRLFEHEFGPLTITSASDPDGGLPLSIKGIIDRVDIDQVGGQALVLDYKTGRLERYEAILRHDLLTTSFQLPLYAAALKADPRLPELGIKIGDVSARYYSLRHGLASQGELADQQMISLCPSVQAQAPERNVAEVAYRLWRRLRDGDFRVDPHTCEGCGLEAACRVSVVARDEADGPAGLAGGAST